MKDTNVIAGLLEDISMDALLYFTTHAMLVVSVCALTFFLLGLYVGFLTWGKYKRRSRAYYEEIQLQRSEIANLKRRLSERNIDEPAEETQVQAPVINITPPPRESLAAVVLGKAIPSAPVPNTVSGKEESVPGNEVSTEAKPEVLPPSAEIKSKPKKTPPPALVRAVEVKKQENSPASESNVAVEQSPESKTKKVAKDEKTASLEPEQAQASPKEAPLPSAHGPITQALVRSVDETRDESSGANGLESSQTPKPNIAPPSSSEVETSLQNGMAVNDERLGIVYHTRPERYDDLTLLRGIGEALHLKLQEHGVYTFRQIALWTEGNIKEFDIRLAAKDRIHREQWVKQARNLHFLKYGEQIQA